MIRTGVTRGRPNPCYMKFPERLRQVRKAAGFHPTGLALAAGISGSMVTLWEAEQGLPRLPNLEKLANALRVNPGWLAYGLGDAAEAAGSGMLCEGLAARVREVRALLGLSMREVARRAELTEGAVRSTELGRQPGIDTLEALARALGVSPAWLAYGIGSRELPRRRRSSEPAHPPS